MIWLLLLASILPRGPEPTDVDLIELNHVHDDEGRERFTQAIFWDWDDYESRFVVVDWRMVKQSVMWPRRDGMEFRQAGVAVRARHWRETWTQHDPEVEDRARWPVTARRRIRDKQTSPAPR